MLSTRDIQIPDGTEVMVMTDCETALPARITHKSATLCDDCGGIQYWCETPALQLIEVCAHVIMRKQ